MEFSKDREVTVVSDDTNVLILLIYHWAPELNDMHFRSEIKKVNKSQKLWNVKDIRATLSDEVLARLLFSTLGTDATPRHQSLVTVKLAS